MLSETFGPQFYEAKNLQVAAVRQGQFASAFDHFLRVGMFEGRNPSRVFKNSTYLVKNSDVSGLISQGVVKSDFGDDEIVLRFYFFISS